MEQPERHDLAGPDRGRARRPDRVHPRGELADRGEVGDDEVATGTQEGVIDRVALARRPANVELAHWPEGWHAPSACVRPRAPQARGLRPRALGRSFRGDVLDGAAEQLQPGRVELVGPRADPFGPAEPTVEAGGQRFARHQDQVGGRIDLLERVGLGRQRGHDLDPGRAGQAQDVEHVVRATLRRADEAHPRARLQAGDLVDELEVARTDEHRDDRDPAGGQHLGLVGMERRRRDEVVVEAIETFRHVVDEGALDLDEAREGIDQSLGVVAGVGAGALGEQDPDEWTRTLALGGGGEGRGGDLIGREAGVGGTAQHLGDDPGERLRATPLRRPVGDVGPGAVAARDVAGVGEAPVDGPDRVRIDPQRGPELADGWQTRPRQQPPRIDLVGQLPVDLRGDRDVRVALDIEALTGRAGAATGGDAQVCGRFA